MCQSRFLVQCERSVVKMLGLVCGLVLLVATEGVSGLDHEARINNGEKAVDGDIPSILELGFYREVGKGIEDRKITHNCGATAIHANWGLTASHCFRGDRRHETRAVVRSGALNLKDGFWEKDPRLKVYGFEKVVRYPKEPLFKWDIALFKINGTFPEDRIASVGVTDMKFEGPAMVAGWGWKSDGPTSGKLEKTKISLYNESGCGSILKPYGSRYEPISMICAVVGADGKDACVGDSGGPLMVGGSVIGVVSDGPDPCGYQYKPSEGKIDLSQQRAVLPLYTRVGYYLNWIEEVIGDKVKVTRIK